MPWPCPVPPPLLLPFACPAGGHSLLASLRPVAAAYGYRIGGWGKKEGVGGTRQPCVHIVKVSSFHAGYFRSVVFLTRFVPRCAICHEIERDTAMDLRLEGCLLSFVCACVGLHTRCGAESLPAV